jgi:hypothetical protein
MKLILPSMSFGQFSLFEEDSTNFGSAFFYPCSDKRKTAAGYSTETVKLNCYSHQASILWAEDVKTARICSIGRPYDKYIAT